MTRYHDRDHSRPRINPVFVGATIFAGACVLFTGAVVFYLFSAPRTERLSDDASPVASAPAPPPVKLTFDQLYDEWTTNPIVAQRKYRTQPVEFTCHLNEFVPWGIVVRAEYVRPGHKDWFRSATVVVPDRAKDGLAKCKLGQKVTVRGRADTERTEADPRLVADEVKPVE